MQILPKYVYLTFLPFQIDRTKKPSAKIPDADNRPRAESPTIGKQLISNGRVVPDRSTKPPLDAKASLREEEKGHLPAEKASQLEKSKQEKELQEKQQEEQREKLRQEKQEQEQRAREEQREKEGREPLQKAKEKEKGEKDQPANKGAAEKQEVENAPKELTDMKKGSRTENESPEVRKPDTDKIVVGEKDKVTWTPEMQRRRFAEESRASMRVDSGSGKVSNSWA